MPILIPLSPPHSEASIFRKPSVLTKAPQIITSGFFDPLPRQHPLCLQTIISFMWSSKCSAWVPWRFLPAMALGELNGWPWLGYRELP